jgi:hypothetical protein
MPAGRAILVLLLTLALASLLSATDLVRIAEQQPFGPRRDVALALADGVQRASAFLSLDRPRRALAELTGHDDGPARDVALPPPSTVPPTTPTTATTAATGPSVVPGTSVAPTTTTLPDRRVPSPDQPVEVLLAGDSLMGNLSDEFIRLVHDDPRVDVSTDVHVSTGLARPDVLDWPAELANVVQQRQPDVVVLMLGANDDQPMRDADGHHVQVGSDGWRAEYERRVAQMMDIAGASGRTVVWVGLPAVDRDVLNRAKDVMNAVVRTEAAARPLAHVVDTVPLLGGPGGEYEDYLPNAAGTPIRVRENDGVHITHAGCDLVTPTLYDTFRVEWHLDTPWPPPPTTSSPPTTAAPTNPPIGSGPFGTPS